MLYKYLPSERIDVIQNLEIRFSPLQSLNDPFEASPLIDMSLEKEDMVSFIESGLNELWSNTKEYEKTEENKLSLEQAKKELIEKSEVLMCSRNAGHEVIKLLGDNLGILSLSRSEHSLLMWSHYASGNTGYVLGFHDEHEFFRKKDQRGNITKPIAVVYSQKRIQISPKDENYYQKLLFKKPLEWAYEEEERIFRYFLSKENAIGKDEYNQDIVLSELPKETIAAVYIGYKASCETESEILLALKKHNIECPVYKARICDNEYKIIFDDIMRNTI